MDEPIRPREEFKREYLGHWYVDPGAVARNRIFHEVDAERVRQDEKHGHELDVPVVREDLSYGVSLRAARTFYDRMLRLGKGSHVAIIMEELAEVIHALTPEEMDKELVQLIATCVKALEAHRHQTRAK